MSYTAVHNRNDFVRVPLSERRAKQEKSLVKIVRCPEGEFLSEWSFTDIGKECYGVMTKRPMVYMTDAHDAIEKSMWCYERGMVPLIGESDFDIAAYTARKYEIDQLITDSAFLAKIEPYLKERTVLLESLSIIGSAFSIETLLPYRIYTREARLVLALPETGVIAVATLQYEPRFEVADDVTVEGGETLVITKKTQLTTPITAYDTGIKYRDLKKSDSGLVTFALA